MKIILILAILAAFTGGEVTIGKSSRGRDIKAVRCSSGGNTLVKFVGGIHGDETASAYLMSRFVSSAQGSLSPLNATIWVIPSMNPDGAASHRRANARGVDLNRNFPDIRFPGRSHPTREVETIALMNFTLATPAVEGRTAWDLCVHFHAGALVVSYPYDQGEPQETDESALYRNLSMAYALHHQRMANSRRFAPYGITNGAAWYPISGSMQDWEYCTGICRFSLTVEVSSAKSAPLSPERRELLWIENQNSIVNLIKTINQLGGGGGS